MTTADPAKVPDARPVSAQQDVAADGLARAIVALADGTQVAVDLQLVGTGWLATAINPVGQ